MDAGLSHADAQQPFRGNVLAARSGMVSMADTLDKLAAVAANYETEAGRSWRPLRDTTNEEIISNRHPEPYPSWQRVEDYYSEGQLIWTEADAVIRARSGGRRSMDDFARAFFGMRDRDWGELTYTFDDVVAALNRVEPYDWAAFLHARVDAVNPRPPLDGITAGGYRLVYTAEPGHVWSAREKGREITDLSYSLGLTVGKDNLVTEVLWDSPAFKAGITKGATLVAVNGDTFDPDELKAVITAAKGGTAPTVLLIKQGNRYRQVDVAWNGGLRYPHLERTGKGPGSLDRLFQPR